MNVMENMITLDGWKLETLNECSKFLSLSTFYLNEVCQ